MFEKIIDPADPNVPALIGQFGFSEFESAEVVDFGPTGRCYWNCDDYVAKHGGKVIHGWQIIGWPLVWVSLFHHAVVRKPNGQLIDVTKPEWEHTGATAFVPDQSITPPRDYPIMVENRYLSFGGTCEAAQMTVDTHVEQCRILRRLAQIAKEQGVTVTPLEPLRLLQTPEVKKLAGEFAVTRHKVDKARQLCRAEEARRAQSLRARGQLD
jgi:hypothetical protein